MLAIHGGAGVISETVKKYGEAAYLDTLRAALAAGREVLANDGAAIDAVQAAVEVMEDSPLFNAGRGSVFAANGQHEMEASLQDGCSRRAGAVLGLRTTRHPIAAARAVMDRTRHVALSHCDEWLAAQGVSSGRPVGSTSAIVASSWLLRRPPTQ